MYLLSLVCDQQSVHKMVNHAVEARAQTTTGHHGRSDLGRDKVQRRARTWMRAATRTHKRRHDMPNGSFVESSVIIVPERRRCVRGVVVWLAQDWCTFGAQRSVELRVITKFVRKTPAQLFLAYDDEYKKYPFPYLHCVCPSRTSIVQKRSTIIDHIIIYSVILPALRNALAVGGLFLSLTCSVEHNPVSDCHRTLHHRNHRHRIRHGASNDSSTSSSTVGNTQGRERRDAVNSV